MMHDHHDEGHEHEHGHGEGEQKAGVCTMCGHEHKKEDGSCDCGCSPKM